MDRDKPRTLDTRVFTLESDPRRRTDIVRITEQVIEDLKPSEKITCSLTVDIDDPVVLADVERIMTALMNIATNAVEAMPDGGTLSFAITGDERGVVVAVRDTGTGITRENMDQLFTPFFTTKPAGEGLGLGLPTAYAAVRAHGGTITVETNADPARGPTGTTVRIALPRGGPGRPETARIIVHGDE